MAQGFVSGPVDIWCGVGSGGAPLFLGHGQRGPRIQVRRAYQDMWCDLGGGIPFDKAYAGAMGIVSVELSRWNENVLRIIQDAAVTNSTFTVAPGLNDPGEVGSLMVQEGIAYNLFLRFPHSAKPSYATQPLGFRFVAAFLEGPDDFEDLGPKPRKVGLIWTCLRTFDTTVSNVYGTGRMLLYDTNVTGLGAHN
jgi:hypothetical protein